MSEVQGAMSALITPFKNNILDENCYEKLILRQLDNGMDAVVPVGTTGESPTLSEKEHEACIKIAVATCKNRAKVLAGAGSNDTATAIRLSKFAQSAGAHSILSVVPAYNKPSQEGLYQHFSAIAKAVDIPVLLYNVPARTGLNLEIDTIIRLYKDFPNIYGVKEASGCVATCASLLAKEREMIIMSGDDAINLPILAVGGKGLVSVTGNLLPDLVSKMLRLCEANKYEEAKELNIKLVDINKILFCEANPIPLKAAMHIAGLCELEYRLPLCKPSLENMKKIEKVMLKYEIKK